MLPYTCLYIIYCITYTCIDVQKPVLSSVCIVYVLTSLSSLLALLLKVLFYTIFYSALVCFAKKSYSFVSCGNFCFQFQHNIYLITLSVYSYQYHAKMRREIQNKNTTKIMNECVYRHGQNKDVNGFKQGFISYFLLFFTQFFIPYSIITHILADSQFA